MMRNFMANKLTAKIKVMINLMANKLTAKIKMMSNLMANKLTAKIKVMINLMAKRKVISNLMAISQTKLETKIIVMSRMDSQSITVT